MHLWHQDLIEFLSREQLLGQHRELCTLRGRGLGIKHSTVDYVFKHSCSILFHFHQLVIKEMEKKAIRLIVFEKISTIEEKHLDLITQN